MIFRETIAIVIDWLKLLRLPNVFTAVADVTMGYLITHRNLEPVPHVALLITASCLLYLSGMVLNDVFDAEVDARDRPDRPIPSGRVPLRTATAVGWSMLTNGALVGWLTTIITADWRPGAVGSALAVCVLLYDGVLKKTPAASLLMGACRALNVLLGMSLAPTAWNHAHFLIALGVGVFIVGVTIFARTEAGPSSRGRLI
ncbi:MAG: UbiA family prenyltransferase, partial [Pirellulales bacterium]